MFVDFGFFTGGFEDLGLLAVETEVGVVLR
jgi:hypothetical protein